MTRQVRKKPRPGTSDGWDDPSRTPMESKLYEVLSSAYQRADSAARAVARLEYELAKDLNVQQVDGDNAEITKEAAMQEVGSDFDHASFESIFTNLNLLCLIRDLTAVLGLEHLRSELFSAVIDDKFKSRQFSKPSQDRTNTVIGTDAEVLLHNIKRTVERAQRSRGGNGTSKAVG